MESFTDYLRKWKNFSVRALQALTFLLEDLLAWSVLAGLLMHSFWVAMEYIAHPGVLVSSEGVRLLLADALLVAMGAEFVRTFLQHTPETVVEVLTFAIVRHIVIDAHGMADILVGCVAVLMLILGENYVLHNLREEKRARKERLKKEKMERANPYEAPADPNEGMPQNPDNSPAPAGAMVPFVRHEPSAPLDPAAQPPRSVSVPVSASLI